MITKSHLNLIIVVFILTTCAGCNRTGEIKNAVNTDKELYKIEFVELGEIPDSTYTINLKDNSSMYFSKLSDSSSTIISIRTFEEQEFSDDGKFTLFAENYIESKMKSYEMKSLHFDIVGFKKTTCLKFDGTYKNKTNLNRIEKYICQEGYLCLLPDNTSRIAEIKLTHYSSKREVPKSVIYDYQALVEQLKFTKGY